ncbi:MAG: hypothetical protein QNJ53_28885 [Pleurocapsa sp. MO_192.B19]|nr:hypothetical protein [Pleurocapsa sp. MO_192.B19]
MVNSAQANEAKTSTPETTRPNQHLVQLTEAQLDMIVGGLLGKGDNDDDSCDDPGQCGENHNEIMVNILNL